MSVNLNRGNHETLNMNRVYGFTGEVAAKFTGKTFPLFTELFCALPLGHCIGGTYPAQFIFNIYLDLYILISHTNILYGFYGAGKVLVVHGGLFSQDGVRLISSLSPCLHGS